MSSSRLRLLTINNDLHREEKVFDWVRVSVKSAANQHVLEDLNVPHKCARFRIKTWNLGGCSLHMLVI